MPPLSIQASNVYYILLLSIVFAILAIHIFLHFNARSSLFSQVGLPLKFPVFLQKGRLGRFRMDTLRNPFPGSVVQPWGSVLGWRESPSLGGFKDSSTVPQLCDQYSKKTAPQEHQAGASGAAGEGSPCVKGHCCFGGQELGPWMTPAILENPAGHCPGKNMEPNNCLCFPNWLYTVFQKPKLGMVFTTVSVCPAAREKGRSCEAFHTPVQLIQSWQRDAEPMSGSISSRRLWRCWLLARRTLQ